MQMNRKCSMSGDDGSFLKNTSIVSLLLILQIFSTMDSRQIINSFFCNSFKYFNYSIFICFSFIYLPTVRFRYTFKQFQKKEAPRQKRNFLKKTTVFQFNFLLYLVFCSIGCYFVACYPPITVCCLLCGCECCYRALLILGIEHIFIFIYIYGK